MMLGTALTRKSDKSKWTIVGQGHGTYVIAPVEFGSPEEASVAVLAAEFGVDLPEPTQESEAAQDYEAIAGDAWSRERLLARMNPRRLPPAPSPNDIYEGRTEVAAKIARAICDDEPTLSDYLTANLKVSQPVQTQIAAILAERQRKSNGGG
jgi:hypothetical protein